MPAAARCSAVRRERSLTSVDDKNTVQMQPVQIALTQGNTVVIASGLQAGDQVVTDGQEKLQAGSRVSAAGARPDQSRNAQVTEGNGSQS